MPLAAGPGRGPEPDGRPLGAGRIAVARHPARPSPAVASRSAPLRSAAFLATLLAAALLGTAARAAPDAGAPPAPAVALAPPGLAAGLFPRPARPVAGIVSDQWASEDSRERAGEADTVMDILGVRSGMTVADVGAGSGYYAVRLARRVGPEGRVIAQDVMPEYLETLRRRVEREGLGNVELALGEPHDPRLPAGSADLALLVHMYHEIEQPYGLLRNLLPALRPGARVAILDAARPTAQHGTPPALLRCELAASGYREVGWHPLAGGAEYLAVFEPPTAPSAPDRIVPCRS